MRDSIIIHSDFSSSPKDYYVYAHYRADTGTIFYVGKGKANRVLSTTRSEFWKSVARKHGVIARIIIDGLQEWAALEIECDLIAKHGRYNEGGTLVNLTDGGESNSNMSPESIEKRASKIRGRKLEQWHIEALNLDSEKRIAGLRKAVADNNIYVFVSKEGNTFTGTRKEFELKFNIDPKPLFATRFYHHVKGWGVCWKDETVAGCLHRLNNWIPHNFDHNVYKFIHTSGLTFSGTRKEFMTEFGYLNKKEQINMLFRKSKPLKSIYGWSLVKE